MTLALATFAGFETGNTDEILVVKGPANDIVTSPVPPFPHETYCLRMAEHATVDPIVTTYPFAVTNDLILAFYVRFVNATPSSDLPFFQLTSGTRVHMTLTCKTDGKIMTMAANGVTSTSGASCLFSNTWHCIEIRLTKADAGSCDVYVDGVSRTSGGIDFSASSGDVEMRFTGSLTGATNRTFYVDNIVGFTGGSSVSDFKGIYRVFMYQHRDNTATPDFGDALESSTTWDDSGETPHNDSNTSKYVTKNRKGVVQTHSNSGGMTPGPKNDSRITGSILGCSFVARWSADSTVNGSTFDFHRGAGDGSDGTALVNLGSSSVVAVRHEVFDASHADCPSSSEYFQYGFGSPNVGLFTTRDATLHECWCGLLHDSPDSTFRGITLGHGFGRRDRDVLIG